MCFYYKLSETAQELEDRFQAKFENDDQYLPANYNGFQFPKAPIIT